MSLLSGTTGPPPGGAGGRARLAAWLLPAAIAALLMLAIHAGLALSVAVGRVEGPWPHLDGNTSVSRACRHPPAVHVFRALALPTTTLLALFWWVATAWLRERRVAGPRVAAWILGLGLAGALFLALYATYLGTDGPFYRALRRYGIYVFFGGTGIAQLLLTWVLARADPERLPELEPWVRRGLVTCVRFMLAAGPVNIVTDWLVEHDAIANALEWWFAVALAAVAALVARVWRRAGLALTLARSGEPPPG